MLKLPLFTTTISKHFRIHPSRQKTLPSMIFGVICSGNVHHQSLSRYVGSPNPKAALRKVERFFVKRNYLTRTMPELLLSLLVLKESLISVLIDPTGSLGKRVSIIWYSVGKLAKKSRCHSCLWTLIRRGIQIPQNDSTY